MDPVLAMLSHADPEATLVDGPEILSVRHFESMNVGTVQTPTPAGSVRCFPRVDPDASTRMGLLVTEGNVPVAVKNYPEMPADALEPESQDPTLEPERGLRVVSAEGADWITGGVDSTRVIAVRGKSIPEAPTVREFAELEIDPPVSACPSNRVGEPQVPPCGLECESGTHSSSDASRRGEALHSLPGPQTSRLPELSLGPVHTSLASIIGGDLPVTGSMCVADLSSRQGPKGPVYSTSDPNVRLNRITDPASADIEGVSATRPISLVSLARSEPGFVATAVPAGRWARAKTTLEGVGSAMQSRSLGIGGEQWFIETSLARPSEVLRVKRRDPIIPIALVLTALALSVAALLSALA